MAHCVHSLLTAPNSGKLITLGEPGCTVIDISARGECWVKPYRLDQHLATTSAAPDATPAPSSGNQVAGWYHLKADEGLRIDLLDNATRNRDLSWHSVQIWGIDEADLQVVGV